LSIFDKVVFSSNVMTLIDTARTNCNIIIHRNVRDGPKNIKVQAFCCTNSRLVALWYSAGFMIDRSSVQLPVGSRYPVRLVTRYITNRQRPTQPSIPAGQVAKSSRPISLSGKGWGTARLPVSGGRWHSVIPYDRWRSGSVLCSTVSQLTLVNELHVATVFPSKSNGITGFYL